MRTCSRLVAPVAAMLAAGAPPGLAAETVPIQSLTGEDAPAGAIFLDTLNVGMMTSEWGAPSARKSLGHGPIKIGGVEFRRGIGTHIGEWNLQVDGAALQLVTAVGVDDDASEGKPPAGPFGTATFQVWVDGKLRADSGVRRLGQPPVVLSVDLRGARHVRMVVGDAGDGSARDRGDWAGAYLRMAPNAKVAPRAVPVPRPPSQIPLRAPDVTPVVHAPTVVGTTPGRPFVFRVPATGQAPLRFSAAGLPRGLQLDEASGVITGAVERRGRHAVALTVSNQHGSAASTLTIVAAPRSLALTPPMGWSSWNAWGMEIDAAKIRRTADALVRTGLAAHGYQYVNVDDGWAAGRDADGNFRPNERFGDIAELARYVHERGLKLGLYSSPGKTTCGGLEGSMGHEEADARRFAEWGVDYLKYDWCSYRDVAPSPTLEQRKKPYRIMGQALARVPRDIVYSLCQYGEGDVWTWGASVGGHLWRTSPDLVDNWNDIESLALDRYAAGKLERHAGPGRWNDPDMLVVGDLGWGAGLHPSRMTPDEQRSHLGFWALAAAPLLIGADLDRLDPFTLDLLTNDEVIAVDQDALGKAASQRARVGETEVWARPLADGTMAVGLFNRGRTAARVRVTPAMLGLRGPQPARDLWWRKDVARLDGAYAPELGPNSSLLLKVGSPKPAEARSATNAIIRAVR